MPRNIGFTLSQIYIQLSAHLNSTVSVFQFLTSFFVISAPSFPFTSISGHFSPLTAYLSHLSRMHFLACFNQIVSSAIFTLLAFLQLKYNDHTQSVFQTHRVAMLVAITGSVIYFSAYAALLRFPLHSLSFLAHRLVVLSGYVSVASVASVLLTDMAAAFVYAVLGLFLGAELLLFWEEEDDDNDDDAEFWNWGNNIFGGGGIYSGQLAPTLPI